MENECGFSEMLSVTNKVSAALPNRFVEIVVIGDGNERRDRLWLDRDTTDPLCEGEYFDITPPGLYGDFWWVVHESADRVGGVPTFWDFSGTEDQVADAIIDYIEDTGS